MRMWKEELVVVEVENVFDGVEWEWRRKHDTISDEVEMKWN